MVLANQFLPRLHIFAESFTARPVKIITSSHETKEESIQTTDAIRIHIPRELHILGDDEEDGFNVYKGLVALQASAISYNGIPKKVDELDFGMYCEPRSFEEFSQEGELGGFIPLCYNVLELSRRMQCIGLEYKILLEDMHNGFRKTFNPTFLKSAIRSSKVGGDPRIITYGINEIDLVLMRNYWRNLGVDKEDLSNVIQKIALDPVFGDFREEMNEVFEKLSLFPEALESTFKDSVERTCGFADYISNLCKDLQIRSVIAIRTDKDLDRERIESNIETGALDRQLSIDRDVREERLQETKKRYEKLEACLRTGKTDSIGLDSEEKIERRMSLLKRRIENLEGLKYLSEKMFVQDKERTSMPYTVSEGISSSIRVVFRDVPKSQLIQLKVPIESESSEAGKTLYFPEWRNGLLEERAVKAIVYDLSKSQPPSEQERKREQDLERQIHSLEQEAAEYNRKIHSDICYIYENLPQIVKKRDSAERKIDLIKKQLKKSKKIHQNASRIPLYINTSLVRRIEREMEKIKPQARTMVRNCFEGELDEKRFFEYWLETQQGGNPLPNFYFEWQKRKRDVASVLLLDASHSTNRLAAEEKTVLEIMKESAYYFVLAADFLEDNSAVIAYNGRGPVNSRVFLLKDFSENPSALKERLELLRGELNNRDGSAIRYCVKYLSEHPAKTKFLFHIGDMQPSDLEFEIQTDAILTYPYQGSQALADVSNAFNYARANGIIPIGICLKKPELKKTKAKSTGGKLNLEVLKKLKSQLSAQTIEPQYFDEIMQRNFRAYYRVVENLAELPSVLRKVYLRTSFR